MPDNLYCKPCRLLLCGELSVISHSENGVRFDHHDDYESFNTAMHLPCAICSLAYTYAKNSPCAVSWVKLVGYYHWRGDEPELRFYPDSQSLQDGWLKPSNDLVLKPWSSESNSQHCHATTN
jgi:hypothetical protein